MNIPKHVINYIHIYMFHKFNVKFILEPNVVKPVL